MSWFKAEVFVLYFVIVFDLLNGMFFTTTNQIEIAFMFFGCVVERACSLGAWWEGLLCFPEMPSSSLAFSPLMSD